MTDPTTSSDPSPRTPKAPHSAPPSPTRTKALDVPLRAVTTLLLLVALLVLAGWLLSKDVFSSEVRLPLLAIAGVIALIAALSFVSLAFAALDLSDKTQALALPEGSIRAVIALTLVVLFAIIGVFLYSSLSDGKLEIVTGLSATEVESLRTSAAVEVALVRSTADGSATVYYRAIHNPASEDFAKQLLTMIGTLVTSVASFYFGSRSTISAQNAVNPPPNGGAAPPPGAPSGQPTTLGTGPGSTGNQSPPAQPPPASSEPNGEAIRDREGSEKDATDEKEQARRALVESRIAALHAMRPANPLRPN